MQPDQTPQNQLPTQPSPSGLPPSAPPSLKKWMTIGTLIALPVAALLYLVITPYLKQSPTTNSAKTNDALVTTIANQQLTPDAVKAINKDDAFYAYLKSAAQQQKVIVTKEFYFTDSPTDTPTSKTVAKTGFDYQSKQFVRAVDTVATGVNTRDKVRCLDGKEFDKPAALATWQQNSPSITCQLDHFPADVNDGFNAGGLSATQAEQFVSYLHGTAGLLEVKSLSLDQHANKQYLHFTVELHPTVASDHRTYLGAQWLMSAFKKTGLDPDTHPYGYADQGGDGLRLDYYVDPSAKLPAYSMLATTAQKDESGKDLPVTSFASYRTQYQFGSATFDAATTNSADIVLNW